MYLFYFQIDRLDTKMDKVLNLLSEVVVNTKTCKAITDTEPEKV